MRFKRASKFCGMMRFFWTTRRDDGLDRGQPAAVGGAHPRQDFKSPLPEKLLTNATAVMILDGVMRLVTHDHHFSKVLFEQ